ncbi:hypothetical protein NMY22_g20061 [Coprinellus aureogranulatus]|nr:hypothetical protein NMY22_g20061 [Coprinellus aureogranulatus]
MSLSPVTTAIPTHPTAYVLCVRACLPPSLILPNTVDVYVAHQVSTTPCHERLAPTLTCTADVDISNSDRHPSTYVNISASLCSQHSPASMNGLCLRGRRWPQPPHLNQHLLPTISLPASRLPFPLLGLSMPRLNKCYIYSNNYSHSDKTAKSHGQRLHSLRTRTTGSDPAKYALEYEHCCFVWLLREEAKLEVEGGQEDEERDGGYVRWVGRGSRNGMRIGIDSPFLPTDHDTRAPDAGGSLAMRNDERQGTIPLLSPVRYRLSTSRRGATTPPVRMTEGNSPFRQMHTHDRPTPTQLKRTASPPTLDFMIDCRRIRPQMSAVAATLAWSPMFLCRNGRRGQHCECLSQQEIHPHQCPITHPTHPSTLFRRPASPKFDATSIVSDAPRTGVDGAPTRHAEGHRFLLPYHHHHQPSLAVISASASLLNLFCALKRSGNLKLSCPQSTVRARNPLETLSDCEMSVNVPGAGIDNTHACIADAEVLLEAGGGLILGLGRRIEGWRKG